MLIDFLLLDQLLSASVLTINRFGNLSRQILGSSHGRHLH